MRSARPIVHLAASIPMQTAGCGNARAIAERLFFTMKIPTAACGVAAEEGSSPARRIALALCRARRAPARGCFAPYRGFRLLACAGRVERRRHRIVDPLEPHETHLLTRRLRHVFHILLLA